MAVASQQRMILVRASVESADGASLSAENYKFNLGFGFGSFPRPAESPSDFGSCVHLVCLWPHIASANLYVTDDVLRRLELRNLHRHGENLIFAVDSCCLHLCGDDFSGFILSDSLACEGDALMVKLNKLTSTKTQLPYSYYSLPYCCPEHIVDSAENLGEVLRGDRIENSPFVFKMRESQMCSAVCHIKLDKKTAMTFKEKIADEYRVNMILDNLPLVVLVQRPDEENVVVYQHGFHVGLNGIFVGSKEETYFIHNHLTFTVRYHRDIQSDSSRIVGVEVKPFSINHEYEVPPEDNHSIFSRRFQYHGGFCQDYTLRSLYKRMVMHKMQNIWAKTRLFLSLLQSRVGAELLTRDEGFLIQIINFGLKVLLLLVSASPMPIVSYSARILPPASSVLHSTFAATKILLFLLEDLLSFEIVISVLLQPGYFLIDQIQHGSYWISRKRKFEWLTCFLPVIGGCGKRKLYGDDVFTATHELLKKQIFLQVLHKEQSRYLEFIGQIIEANSCWFGSFLTFFYGSSTRPPEDDCVFCFSPLELT